MISHAVQAVLRQFSSCSDNVQVTSVPPHTPPPLSLYPLSQPTYTCSHPHTHTSFPSQLMLPCFWVSGHARQGEDLPMGVAPNRLNSPSLLIGTPCPPRRFKWTKHEQLRCSPGGGCAFTKIFPVS